MAKLLFDGASVLSLEGPLRAPTAMRLRRSLQDLLGEGRRAILLDLRGVSEIDAAGVGELAHAYATVTASDGVLRVAHPPRRVRRLLDLACLTGVLGAGATDPLPASEP